jgi:hypothetical protein
LFSQWQGKPGGFTKGRDRSFHFGTQEFHIIGMISHLGPQLGVADGIALGNLLKENKKVTAVFSGDGGTSEGDFHEALNVAAVWDLPVIFIIENNGYGLSTPSMYRSPRLLLLTALSHRSTSRPLAIDVPGPCGRPGVSDDPQIPLRNACCSTCGYYGCPRILRRQKMHSCLERPGTYHRSELS